MIKYTIQERFYIFAAITLMFGYCYSLYCNYKQDKYINNAIDGHNKVYQRAVEINNELREENNLLRGDVEHWQAMYLATQTSNHQLEQQINVIGDYYRKEIIKVNDELFNLKNTKKTEFSPKQEIN